MDFCTYHKETAVSPAVFESSEGKLCLSLKNIELDGPVKTTPFERQFNPYDFNGG
jgi:hypothetical protein